MKTEEQPVANDDAGAAAIALAPGSPGLGARLRRPVNLPVGFGRAISLELWEVALYGLIVLAVLVSRYLAIGPRAYHHDESVHAKTMWDLMRGVAYTYDPVYHGPFQYYVTAALFKIFGAGDALGRVAPATFGVAAVLIIPALWRKELGRLGTPIAMLAVTVSTVFMYYSRFARDDIYVAFWTLLIFGSLVRYIHRPQRRWVLLAGAAMGLSFVTMENTFITGFIFVSFIGLLGAWAWLTSRGVLADSPAARRTRAAFKALSNDPEGVGWALLIFAVIALVFMSSFLSNPGRVRTAFVDAFTVWQKIHGTQRVNQPWFYYLMVLAFYEPFVLAFGLASLRRVFTRPSVFTWMLFYWAAVSFYVYSVAGEKAAWLSLHPILPVVLLGSWYAGRKLEENRSAASRWALGIAAAALLGWTARNAIPAAFDHGDVPVEFIIYTQTSRDVLTVMDLMEEAGQRTGEGRNIPVYLERESHWPYAWYLRDWGKVAFEGELKEVPSQPIVIVSDETADKLGIKFTDHVGVKFKLREWFPEHVYQSWKWSSIPELFRYPENFKRFWRFLILREPPAPLGSTDFVMYVRRDLLKAGPLGPFTYNPPPAG